METLTPEKSVALFYRNPQKVLFIYLRFKLHTAY